MWKITPYEKKHKKHWEKFREQALAEDNDSLIEEKLDPDNLNGVFHLLWEDGKLASCQAAEVDHYTDNPTALRMCRLHTLKEFRRTTYGMPLTRYQIQWAKENGYEHLWASIDVNRTGYNAIWQNKRKSPNYQDWKEDFDTWWKDIIWNKEYMFKVDPVAEYYQYIYVINLVNKEFTPNKSVVPFNLEIRNEH